MKNQGILRVLVAAIVLSAVLTPADSAHAAGTVGAGTPASCTEAAFNAALAGGGLLTFNCGAAPAFIYLNGTENITIDTTIDGAGKITLDGGGAVQLFSVALGHSLTLKNLTLRHAKGTFGGAVASEGTLVVSNVAFVDNSAGSGPAILNDGTATITNGTFINNTAGASGLGGAIYNTGTLTVSGGYFAGNQAPAAWGGAIASSGTLTVSGSYFTHNSATFGGAIFNSAGTVKIHSSTFYLNSATSFGGAIEGPGVTITASTFDSNSAPSGGAIGADSGVAISESTFSSNSATSTTGGAIRNGGPSPITNSTFYGNFAATDGGAIYNDSFATLTLNNTTIAGSSGGGGLYNAGSASLKNTILSSNTPNNCSSVGTLTSLGHNLDSAHTCNLSGGGDLSGVNPLLGPLANSGGPTKTMRLNAGSPAIDHGSNVTCATKDQRGVKRPQGPTCDIGAYEVKALSFKSVGTYDGWVLETGKATNHGGSLNSTATTLSVGDDPSNRRFRGFVSFDTSALPDGATPVLAKLSVKRQSAAGNPFSTQGALVADLRKPYFGTGLTLVTSDWQASATVSPAATFGSTLVSGSYIAPLNGSGRLSINKTGTTQFRLRFTSDAYNSAAEYLSLFSGDYATSASRPSLIVYYNP